jgi:Rrf2 family protein
VSAKGEYAIKAMLELALSGDEGLRPIQEIAARQGIPQRYLEQVLLQLKRSGLLTSKRGSTGGYRLSRPPQQITVGAVLRAVEGEAVAAARAPRGRSSEEGDELAELWREVGAAVASVIDRISLDDLRQRAREREVRARAMYHI